MTFTTGLSLMWKWGRSKSFDVVGGSTQYTFTFDLGRHIMQVIFCGGISHDRNITYFLYYRPLPNGLVQAGYNVQL